jgi:2-polyprenyl-6-methoxyphenol hydroxylase-like FAD-dependent oxidoreductase
VHAASVASASGRIEELRFDDGGWRLRLHDASGTHRDHSGDWLVEARGRRAPRAGIGSRGIPTLALARRFESGAPTSGAALGTWKGGFAWACWREGRGVLQLFVDPGRRWRNPLEEAFEHTTESLRREAPAFWQSLGRARFRGPVAARGATSLCASEPAPLRTLRVGDAAAAMDPLSGSGVFWAVASAQAAVPVLETLVRRPDRSELALRFYRERVAHHFVHQAELGRSFYAAEERHAGQPFFRRRRAELGTPLAAARAVSNARIELRPVVEDGFIAEREVLVTPEHPLGIWRVNGVPVAPEWRSMRREATRVATTVDDPPADGTK